MNKNNKKLITGAIVIVVLVVLIYWGLDLSNLTLSNNKTTTSNEEISHLIPYMNYTCEDLIPEEIDIRYDSNSLDSLGNSYLELWGDITRLKNNISLGGTCEYNSKVGQKASEFFCKGSFVVENKPISDEGVIQEKKPRTIIYNMGFDDSNCTAIRSISWNGKIGVIRCKILSSACEIK